MDCLLLGLRRANACAVLALICVLLAIPALAWGAGNGGTSLIPTTTSGTTGTNAARGNLTVTATGDGITLATHESTMLRRGITFTGTTAPNAAGKTVVIERLGHQTNWQWAPTATAAVAHDGTFSALWSTNHIGRFSIRALISSQSASSSVAAAAPTVTITVYRPSIATWYGPGLYGRQTACGEKLTPHTIGVANRTLKCGTKVALYYKGRTMIVPVIDRGPYANHADWDLTQATSEALHTPGVATIGAVSLPRQPASTQ